jgi:8-oxo-dGTP pyrophosphatase MutT (NUDIX family)
MARLRVKSLVWIVRPSGDGAAAAQVLLLERPGDRGGGLHPVTGNAERGEPPFDAAQREALEETGLRGELVDLHFRHEFEGRRARFVEHAFLLAVAEGAEVTLSDEHVHALWTDRATAQARLAWEAHRAALLLAMAAWDAGAGSARLKRGG